jgi:hypothetical protein
MRAEYNFKTAVRGKHLQRYKTDAEMDAFIASIIDDSGDRAEDGALFDIASLTATLATHNRYDRRIAQLLANNRYVDNIKETVERAIANLQAGSRSFVIYGEPQSGKTEMMIALTARLLDEGERIILVLLNDNVKLMDQNLSRFRSAGLDPSPKRHDEVLQEEISLTIGEWIIFCKKNGKDLTRLIEKLRPVKDRVVVLDDEADYATPNGKINKEEEQTRINELVEKILGPSGIYVGVTATPARLNLNHTFENETERWIIFKPHPDYKGREVFFPTKLADQKHPQFTLKLLPENYDEPRFLREALFRFFVSVAHLNTAINPEEVNYAMLIHTSGAKDAHLEDYKQVLKTFAVLSTQSHPLFQNYAREIWKTAALRYPGEETSITQYVLKNARRHDEVVMNSDKQAKGDWDRATSPQTPFTIVIGGNIVSRGVTFNNLLSMFFTRDVKHKMQQDTYIQRARMFGDRQAYLSTFELSIPESLYKKWHRCFLFHTLALLAIQTEEKSPVWVEDKAISAVSSSSIDRATVNVKNGEMSFARFEFDKRSVDAILAESITPREKLTRLRDLLGEAALPEYLLNFIDGYQPNGPSIEIDSPSSIEGYEDKPATEGKPEEVNRENIYRRRGFIGHMERVTAAHYIRIFYYRNYARVFYRFNENVTFLKQEA